MPEISVALATYNGALFIEEQLESLERQLARPAELVVCDDRSTDTTVDLIRAFAARASFPVTVHINDERLGWRANFMKAARLCSFDLIALCDQDDIWYPQKLQTMAAQFGDAEVLLAHHGADLIDEHGVQIAAMPHSSFKEPTTPPLTRHTTWANPFGLTIVFRRALLRYETLWADPSHYYAPDKPFPHDQWLFNFAISLGSVCWVAEPLVGYRQHANNVLGWSETSAVANASPDSAAIVDKIDAGLRVLKPFIRAFEKASYDLTGLEAVRMRKAVNRNSTLFARLQMRRELHTRGLPVRFAILMFMLVSGAYKGGRGWTLGKDVFFEDVKAAVLHLQYRRASR